MWQLVALTLFSCVVADVSFRSGVTRDAAGRDAWAPALHCALVAANETTHPLTRGAAAAEAPNVRRLRARHRRRRRRRRPAPSSFAVKGPPCPVVAHATPLTREMRSPSVHLDEFGMHTFTVDARLFGKLDRRGRDHWSLDLVAGRCADGTPFNVTTDGVWASPVMQVDRRRMGCYYFTAAFPPRRACYSLSLFRSQTGYDSTRASSATCHEVRSRRTRMATASLAVSSRVRMSQLAPAASPAQRVVNGSVGAPRRGPRDSCPGYYLSLPDAQWGGAARPDSVHRQWVTSARCRGDTQVDGNKFATDSAAAYFSVADARACLAIKWLAFIGDSTVQELAITTLFVGGAGFSSRWIDFNLSADENISADPTPATIVREFDTNRAGASSSLSLAPGARVTMHWGGGPTRTDNFHGLRVWELPAYVQRAVATLLPGSSGVAGGGDSLRPIIVFNSGLHDLASPSPPYSPVAYAAQLRAAVALLSNLTHPQFGFIWKTSNPKTGHKSCDGGGAVYNKGQAAVDDMNAIALGVLRASSARFSVLDEATMLQPLDGADGLAHHHCAADVMKVYLGQRTIDMIGVGCIAAAQGLLQLICPNDGSG